MAELKNLEKALMETGVLSTRRNFLKGAALGAVAAAVANFVPEVRAATGGGGDASQFGSNIIPIAPMLVKADCSVAQILAANEKTALGIQNESRLGPYTNEFCDTYETVLLPNPNYNPISGQAYFRAKHGEGRFQALGIWPGKTSVNAGDCINVCFDTENLGTTKTNSKQLVLFVGLDKMGRKTSS
ncbi:MAG: twin-arginine translocation signal domain-containing protein, partial [Candidatus Bathyarchaeia archaeon]